MTKKIFQICTLVVGLGMPSVGQAAPTGDTNANVCIVPGGSWSHTCTGAVSTDGSNCNFVGACAYMEDRGCKTKPFSITYSQSATLPEYVNCGGNLVEGTTCPSTK